MTKCCRSILGTTWLAAMMQRTKFWAAISVPLHYPISTELHYPFKKNLPTCLISRWTTREEPARINYLHYLNQGMWHDTRSPFNLASKASSAESIDNLLCASAPFCLDPSALRWSSSDCWRATGVSHSWGKHWITCNKCDAIACVEIRIKTKTSE